MKRLAIAIAATCTAIAPAAFAQYYNSYNSYDNNRSYNSYDDNRSYNSYDDNRYESRSSDYSGQRARVLDSRPVADTGSQREECWNPRAGHYEEVRKADSGDKRRDLAGTVIGGLAGGILGHQIGSGSGNTAATIGGAALGAYAGNRVEKNRNDEGQSDLDRSNCRVIADTSNSPAYDVRYAWQGREYVTRMDHDPGRYVELGRDVNSDGTPFNNLAESSYR